MFKVGSFSKKNDAFQPIAVLHTKTSPRDGLCLLVDTKQRAIIQTPDVELAKGEYFAMEPTNLEDGRDVVMVGGKSGSGKSHTAKNFAIRYHMLWPKRPIYLLSYLQEDETIDELDFIKRIDPSTFVEEPPELKFFNKSLTIFDDIEGFQREQPEIHGALQTIIDMIATTGRHNSSSILVASHLLTDYKRTRLFLGEAQRFVIFPNGCSMKQMTNLLGSYAGCDTKELKRIRRLPSRWVALSTSFPSLVLYESGCYLLHGDTYSSVGKKRKIDYEKGKSGLNDGKGDDGEKDDEEEEEESD